MGDDWGTNDAGRVPLFDRLVDEHRHQRSESRPRRSLDREALRESVRRELTRLLATRCPVPGDLALTRARSTIDYGLPDLEIGGRAIVKEDRLRIARLLRQTIEAFEPRLQRVEVEVLERREGGARLVVAIRATLVTERVRESLNFNLPLPEA